LHVINTSIYHLNIKSGFLIFDRLTFKSHLSLVFKKTMDWSW